MAKTATLLLIMTGLLAAHLGCTPGAVRYERPDRFGSQVAVVSERDEPAGRFDGARLSPGFGMLYINGFTGEATDEPACGGFFSAEPQHILEIGYAMHIKMVLQAADAVALAVRSENGQLTCWDDDSLVNENVSLSYDYSPGRYEVLVGSVTNESTVAYRLVLSE